MLLTQRGRKRTRIEMMEEEKLKADHNKAIEEMEHKIQSLKQRLDELEDVERENRQKNVKLGKLFDMGVINEHGDFVERPDDNYYRQRE